MGKKTPLWAQERIHEARERKQTRLSLRPPLGEGGDRLEAVPYSVFSLTHLEELDLGGNLLTDVPRNLSQLANLKRLSLADNLLALVTDTLSQLTNLESLNLNGNRLMTLSDTLPQLVNLQILSLSRNWLTDVPPVLSQLTKLREVYLADNQLEVVPNSFAHLKDLQILRLNGNQLTDIPHACAHLSNLRVLGLSRNRLTSIPSEIAHLENLRELYLSGNRLSVIPDTISHLAKLQVLWLSNNELTNIPDVFEELVNLEVLDLSGNKLGIIPFALTKLSSLQIVYLSDNTLTDISPSLAQLTNLRELYLSGNRLTDIPDELTQLSKLQNLYLRANLLKSIPSTVSRLFNLRELDLSYNQLKTIPDTLAQLINLQVLGLSRNQFTSVPMWLMHLPKLKTLYLYRNPISTPPPELLKIKTFQPIDLGILRTYFRQLSEQGHNYLYDAKMLIVGEPGAGKTTLARKLLDSSAPLLAPNETTEGIDVHTWTFLLQPDGYQLTDNERPATQSSTTLGNPQFRVNMWDFGGQQIYHATHQFFLTRRSLYVVVADAREQKEAFFHWLDSIEHLSDASPVLILNNEKEDRAWAVNESQLRSHFTNLKEGLFAVNLATNRGLDRLRQAIQYHVTHLPHVGHELPRTWVSVRHALENEPRDYISLDEFLRLCGEHGFARLEDKLQLSSYLHDLGVILHFQDDPLLKKTVILKPEWGTDAVYRLLDSKQVQANQGEFNRADLAQIWDDDNYILMHDELLALMTKFQLCYEIPTHQGTFIAPQLLSEQPPSYPFAPENGDNPDKLLLLRYKYESFMPKGILSRFIVALHPYIAEPRLVWRTGVVLQKDGAQAEVVEWYHRREIFIRVTGTHKRDLLTTITYEMDKLHRPFHRLKYDKLIPCNCPACHQTTEPYFYHLDSLKRRIANKRYEVECDYSFEKVDIWSLIDDIGTRERLLNGEDESAFTDPVSLLRQFETAFSDEEVQGLCFKLSIAYDDLPAEGRNNKMRELITYLQRRGRLAELVELLRQERPNYRW